jgi:uncharacterized protein YfaT (DUF1175 family)
MADFIVKSNVPVSCNKNLHLADTTMATNRNNHQPVYFTAVLLIAYSMKLLQSYLHGSLPILSPTLGKRLIFEGSKTFYLILAGRPIASCSGSSTKSHRGIYLVSYEKQYN